MRHSKETGSAVLTVLVALLMFVAGAASMYWWLEIRPGSRRGPTVATASPSPRRLPSLLPSPLAEPSLVPSSEPYPATVAATPAPSGPPPTQVAAFVPEAAAPAPAVPRAGRARPRTAARAEAAPAAPLAAAPAPAPVPPPLPPPVGGGFFLGRTEVASLKRATSKVVGFDVAGVDVKRAASITGRLELEVEPSPERSGDPYSVRVYLRNDGKKAIQVESMKVSMIVDGKATTRPLPPKARAVLPRERTLLEELPGVWTGTPRSWAVEVEVTSKGQDVYRNRLIWQ